MKISDLQTKHRYARAVHTPRSGGRETGIITSWNDECVFVLYPPDTYPKATRPEDLELVPEPIASAACPHCGTVRSFPGFDEVFAFICSNCGEGVIVEETKQ